MTYLFYLAAIGLIVLSSTSADVPPTYKSYDGYQLVRIFPKTAEQVKLIDNVESALGEQLDFWKESKKVAPAADAIVGNDTAAHTMIIPTELLLSKQQKEKINDYLQEHGIESTIQIEDVGSLVRDDAIASLRPEGVEADAGPNFNLNEYHAHSEILNYLQFLAQQNSKFVELRSIGRSYENRNLTYIKIGYPSDKPKNVYFVDAGIHAREWITPAVALHFINQLVNNKTHRALLKEIDIYVLPSLNPDGYEYSRKVDRLWRKSRTGPRGPHNCYGVDLNRNFNYFWGFSGVSHNPCSEIYCGPVELSENESQALTKFFKENNNTIKAYISLHSYGNLIIHPWGHIEHSYPDDIEDVYNAGLEAAHAISAANGPKFIVGASPQILYEVAGSSQDFAKSAGIKYTYTMELTNAPGGFIFPNYQIQSVADQIVPGLLVFAERVRGLPTTQKKLNTH